MTTGVLIFAFNNEKIDYLAMANWSAKNIRRHLGLPVAVVTDKIIPTNYHFEQVIPASPEGIYTRKFADQDIDVTWYNGNRVDAYRLSPWSQTLVLDADYVVASDQLKLVLSSKENFIAHKKALDVTNHPGFDEHNIFGRTRMPMWWATIMMFRRSSQAESIFDCMTMIKNNWKHYRNLYGISQYTYRNDYALTMALGIVNGHILNHSAIPWDLASVSHEHKLTQLDIDTYRVDYLTQDQKSRYLILKQDFHAMGKGQLGAIIDKS